MFITIVMTKAAKDIQIKEDGESSLDLDNSNATNSSSLIQNNSNSFDDHHQLTSPQLISTGINRTNRRLSAEDL